MFFEKTLGVVWGKELNVAHAVKDTLAATINKNCEKALIPK
jgi:hypothetical protein